MREKGQCCLSHQELPEGGRERNPGIRTVKVQELSGAPGENSRCKGSEGTGTLWDSGKGFWVEAYGTLQVLRDHCMNIRV